MVPGGQHVIKCSKSDFEREWVLWTLGDVHWGSKGCWEDGVDEHIEQIRRTRRARWVGMGDYVDLIAASDNKRFDPEDIAHEHRSAYFTHLGETMKKYAREKFRPIRNKCFGMLTGNHEHEYARRFAQAIVRDICVDLGIQFLGYSFCKDLVFTDGERTEKFRFFGHHGAGGAQTKGGKLNRVERWAKAMDADIVLWGHVHGCMDDVRVTLTPDTSCTKLLDKKQMMVMTGTFLRTYTADPSGASGYGERKAYEPTVLGCPGIKIIPATRKMSVEKP